MRRILGAVVAVALAAGIGWFALAGGDERPGLPRMPQLPYRSRGISLSLVPSGGLSAGEMAEGAAGDYVVQNGRLSFVVGADAPGVERQARKGVLLDLSLNDFQVDELFDLRPMVKVAGKAVGLGAPLVSWVSEGRYPFLQVTQTSSDGRLTLTTEFQAAPLANSVRLISRFRNGTDALLRAVEIGERTRWPGAPSFAPRVGFPRLTSRAEVPWLARQGRRLAYALAFVDGPVQASFFFDLMGQVGQETLAQVGDAPPGSSLSYQRELFVVEGDLARAAELVLRSLKREIGHVEGQVRPAPAWGIVEARTPDQKPALSVRLNKDGKFRLPLVGGDYHILVRSPGGEDEADVSVVAGRATPLELIAPVPGQVKYAVTDGDGAALSARLTFRGLPPTKDPELLPGPDGERVNNVVNSRSGSGEVELPPGRYRVVASHGPEYEISDQEFEVDSENGAALRATLRRSVETLGWLACDFHLHAAPSRDSSVSLEDRVLSLLVEGIEFAVPTDHNHLTDYSAAVRHHRAEAELGTTPGVEVTTSTWGHFNAYPYPAHAAPPPFSGVNPIEIFAAVRARAPGALIQVNHPRMPGVGYFNRIELSPETAAAATEGASLEFDALEVVNGYDLESPKLIEQNLKEYFALLNVGRRYTATGNSDSHRLVINWAGYPRTYVRVPDREPGRVAPADVARAVDAGRVLVSNGIFISVVANGTAGPGDLVTGKRVTLDVVARAPSWVDLSRVEVFQNGVVVGSSRALAKPLPGHSILFQAELAPKIDSWIAVVAHGDQPMSAIFYGRRVLPFAFTNPIFVDADEDGVYRAPDMPETQLPNHP